MQNSSNVEKFLNLVKQSRRGKFKIYLGMAAGVGKTYKMLLDAHQMLGKGVDITIGIVETHRRNETEALVEGIPKIRMKKIFYKGKELEELDVETVIRQHPDIVIVDELAHSNISGSKNEKRYQDVEEILNAGISVISAVNIQHIESLNNIVKQITGVEVSERVPDYILQMADEVVNIDLSVDELLERLKAGKIYKEDKIGRALDNFFQKENLLYLRELVLREAANLVEKKIDNEFITLKKKSSDKYLVCISTNEDSAKTLIRKCARIAERTDSEWYVLYIQTVRENSDKIDLATQRKLINNLNMAAELGAGTVKLKGNNIAEEIVKFAKEKNVTNIYLGRTKNNILKKIIKGNLIDKISNLTDGLGIDIHLVV